MKKLKKKRLLNIIFKGVRFHMLPQFYKSSHELFLNNVLKFWLTCNQRYQVPLFRYINRDDEVSHLVRVRKVIGDMKYLMRSVKQAAEVVGIWIKET